MHERTCAKSTHRWRPDHNSSKHTDRHIVYTDLLTGNLLLPIQILKVTIPEPAQ